MSDQEKCQRVDCGLYGTGHWQSMCRDDNCKKFTTAPTTSIPEAELEELRRFKNRGEQLESACGNHSLESFIKETNELKADKELLDWLQGLTDENGKPCIFRWSSMGRGWRLHQTSDNGGVCSVRAAINRSKLKSRE